MADTAVGIFSGERRGENFQRRKNPQNELELLESKRKALENMTPAYKERLMTQQGVSSEMDLDINSSYDQYVKSFEGAQAAAFADELTEGYKTQNLIAGVSNELAGIASLVGVLPGITMEGVYESLRTPIKYNRDLMGDLTPEEDRFIQDFIEENSIAVQGGRALVIIPELLSSVAAINPKTIQRVNSFLNKRNTGQKTTAAEQRQMVSDVKEMKTMLAQPRKKSITKPAPAPDKLETKGETLKQRLLTEKDAQGKPKIKKKGLKFIDELVKNPTETNPKLGAKLNASSRTIKRYKEMLEIPQAKRDISSFTAKTEATKKVLEELVKQNPDLNYAELSRLPGTPSASRISEILDLKTGSKIGGRRLEDMTDVPGMELIEDLKNRTDALGRPYLSEYMEKYGLLEELENNKYIDPRTNEPFTPEDWLVLKKPDGTPYAKSSQGSIRSKIRQGPKFLDKKAAYQKTYMAERKATEPGYQEKFNEAKKEEYYKSKRKQIDAKQTIKAPGKGVLMEERNRLLAYLSDAAKNQKKIKGELADFEEVFKNNKFVGVKDNTSGITYLEAGYKGKLKSNEKLISDHPEATNIIDLIDTAKKFKYQKLNKVLSDYFSDFNELPNAAELFNFLSADRKFLDYMSKQRMTNNPLEIHHILGKDYEPAKFLQLTLRDRNDAAGKVFRNFVQGRIDEKTATKQIKSLNVRVKLPGGKKFIGGKQLTAVKALAEARKRLTKMAKKEIKENPKFKEEFKNYFNNIIYKRQKFSEGGSVTNINDGVKKEIKNFNKIYEMSQRQFFQEGDFVVKNLQDLNSVKALQEQIKQMYNSEIAVGIRDATDKKFEEIQEEAKQQLRTERPVKFKISELANAAEEFVFKPAGTLMTAPIVAGLNTIESVYNAARKGVENDVDMKEKFPQVFKLFDYYTSGIGPTPDDQTYIGFIDESIRSVQKGGQNTAYNILDLAYVLPDFAFDTNLQERLQEEYDKHAFAEPETFLGNAGSILVEFGVPSTTAFKFLNMMRRGLKARTGINLMATSTYGMKGAEKAKTAISNVAKRVGIVAPSAFAGEFVGGGPYNTVSREFADDPLFLDETLGYDYIDTRNLSGKELQIANFKNRIRFGTDGAIVAGMFPLLGPALAKATKNGLIKPSAYVAGKGLQVVNYVGIKPVSYLLARTPGVSQTGQIAAKGLSLGAQFLGKDVLARAVVGALGSPTLKQLPDFKDWRMFEVTSSDPLEKNLKRFDNFLAYFRDTANQTADRFFLTGQTERKIKATSRKIEKQLDIIEKRAYDLARGFLKDYNTNTSSPAKQQYYLDQVLGYLKGQVDLTDLPTVLQNPASALNKTFINIKSEFADVLPKGAGLKDFLNNNLREYMRASFASFTNPFYTPDRKVFSRAVDFMIDRINKNDNMVDAALRASNLPPDEAIRNFATKQVESILERGKADGQDPLDALGFIARDNLKMDDLVVQTGEELPDVIRKLLGEENSLRASVMTTASDLASQTANVQMYNKLAGLGLREGWLFSSAEDAIAAGIANPKRIGPRLPGLGKLNSPISEAYGNKEVVESIVNTTGPLDNLLKNGLYQNLIAYKALVQTGKTVMSPATQTRNFGSAAFFPLQSGHIGGAASVQDAFKIILDDVFGAGKTLNEQQLIDRITRKVELGVLDENVVVSELKDILKDVKAGNMKSLAKFSDRVDNTKLSDVATRLYAGGDNVWKWYGHEFVMSQLKNGFKNVDDVVAQYKNQFGATINPKDLHEGIEQYAATLIRETYPTYSKVPKLIQTIRRIPFIGNFVSFPAEILRTTFATTANAMKHIASDNAALRELGYRTLMGQFITYGGIGAGTTYLGQAMTNVTSQELEDIKQHFVPEFMRFSDLVPITDIEDGVLKVFDNSRYFPYDLITTTVGNAINRASKDPEKLDPAKIESDMFKDIYNYTGPFADLAGGTLFGVSIGYEPALDFLRGGKTKTGSAIYSESDTSLEKFDKMFAHTFETINPGVIRTLENLFKGAAGALTGTGQPIKMTDQVFKLFGGSSVTIDIPGSFRYQIGELKSSFKEPRVSEGFYRPDFRTGAQLVREYNEQNEEAFREQYEFYKVVRAAIRNDFMDEDDVEELLEERVGKKTAQNIIEGIFTPLSTSEGALEGRFKNMERGNPDEFLDEDEFLPLDQLEDAKDNWEDLSFEDFEREQKEPKQRQQMSEAPAAQPVEQEPQTPPLPDTGAAQPGPPPVASVPNPATGLTPVESSLLSREEQLIRQRQRGLA